MRSIVGSTLLCAALGVISGCGPSQEGRRAGGEPLPSSQTTPLPPAPSSSSGPMFAGVSQEFRRGERPRGGIFGRAFDAVENAERAGPQRIESPEAAGRRIAEETLRDRLQEVEQNATRDDDACQEAWNTRLPDRPRDRQEFLTQCRTLPESQQRCLSITYQLAHADECAEIHEREGRQFAERTGFDPDRPGAMLRP